MIFNKKLTICKSYFRFYDAVCNTSSLRNKLILSLDKENLQFVTENEIFLNIPYINVSINCETDKKTKQILLKYLENYLGSIENITFSNCKFADDNELFNILSRMPKLKYVKFENCCLRNLRSLKVREIITLKSVSFKETDENLYKFFENQSSIEKVSVESFKKSWHAFPLEAFNDMIKSLPNLKHIVFIGEGTGCFFDRSEFPFKIEILEAETITFHWYVGITGARTKFLISQQGSLKELRINQLPYDFDGGRVIKFIINEMNLEKFYYQNIPIILNGQKQNVKHISTKETQITAAFEMFRQFPGKFS